MAGSAVKLGDRNGTTRWSPPKLRSCGLFGGLGWSLELSISGYFTFGWVPVCGLCAVCVEGISVVEIGYRSAKVL